MNRTRLSGATVALAALALVAVAGPAFGADRNGTSGADTLIGTRGEDTITGVGGDDTLKGLAGDDTYLFADGWGTDTLVEKRTYRVNGATVAGGIDTLSFSGVANGGLNATLIPEWRRINPTYARAAGPNGEAVDIGGSVVENVVGTVGDDFIGTGAGANTVVTGGGRDDLLMDSGGWDDGPRRFPNLPASNDTYAGAPTNVGTVVIVDWGGAADVLDLRPLRSDQVVLNRIDCDGDRAKECLQVVTPLGEVVVAGQFGETYDYTADSGQRGQIERVRFTDKTVSFGGKGRLTERTADGEALLGRAETEYQQQLAARAPALAERAPERVRNLPLPLAAAAEDQQE